jgi:hypothetical protein
MELSCGEDILHIHVFFSVFQPKESIQALYTSFLRGFRRIWQHNIGMGLYGNGK